MGDSSGGTAGGTAGGGLRCNTLRLYANSLPLICAAFVPLLSTNSWVLASCLYVTIVRAGKAASKIVASIINL